MLTHHEAMLQRSMDRLKQEITEMSALAERALRDCVRALKERNRQLAYAVVLRDRLIDEKEKQVDRLCLEFLVKQHPVATTLRFAYSAIKINLELERVGDYAESIARQTLKLIPLDLAIPIERFEEIANLSIPMLRDAIQAFLNQDAELAKRTMATEEAVDALKSKLNKSFVAQFREQQFPFEALNALMMITRRLERVSDQARNICLEVLYLCTGEYAKHQGTEAVRVVFVDGANSCLSQMAEAVGRALDLPQFVFSSAGLEPKPLEPAMVQFMKAKGLDMSRMVPKAVYQVPNLDHYQVIVALEPEAKRAFPQRPRKVIYLDWALQDPTATPGTPAQVQAAFEEAYALIAGHVRDLVDAITGPPQAPPTRASHLGTSGA